MNMNKARLLSLASITSMMGLLVSCGGHRENHELYELHGVRVTGVALNQTQLTLDLDSNTQASLTASVQPNNATNKNVTWQSSNPAIASVTNNGLVKAHAPGTATITVITQDCGYYGHDSNHHSDGHSSHYGGSHSGQGHFDNCNGGHVHTATVHVYDHYQNVSVTSIAGIVEKNAQGHSLIGDIVLAFNSTSKIEIDGIASSKKDLQAGMTIEAQGELVGNQFNCTKLATNSILRGNIDSIDFANNALLIGKTTVVVGDHANIANYSTGDAIKVFGNYVDGDKIFATCMVNSESGHIQANYTAQGPMTNHNGQNKTFQCGRFTVDYSSAKVEGTATNGGQVLVSGPVVNGVMQAQTCRFYYDANNNQAAVGNWCVYGRMTNWDPSTNQFQIGSGYGCCCIYYWINYDQYTPGAELIAAASTGTNLRIEGTLTQSGGKRVVKATKISK
jgi:hypothetical protein